MNETVTQTDPFRERLSEYLDGSLSEEATLQMESHLEECEDCRALLDELRGVVLAAVALVDRPPERDLWPSVVERIRASKVVSLSGGRDRARRRGARRYVRLSLPQAAAAALALILGSGGAAWIGTSWREDQSTSATERWAADPATSLRVDWNATMPEAVARLEEIARLQAAAELNRDRLSAQTLRVLEKNLSLIDRAIEESVRALELDPASPFLRQHIDDALRRKATLLREMASVAERVS